MAKKAKRKGDKPAAETLLGWSFKEVRERNMHDVSHRRHTHGPPHPAGACAACRVIETGEPVTDQMDEFVSKDGKFFPVVYGSAPLREGKNVVGTVVVFRDITERSHAEERERVLAKEFAHRNRNLFAIVHAIVARSLTNRHSLAENRSTLMHRLEALARSQQVLESGRFEGASLAEIVRMELEAFPGRHRPSGPDVALNAKAAQNFALLVHELATNATKHGALSYPSGRIGIAWSIEGENAEARFKFRWLERGGPPVVPPNREGFGRVLIEKVAAQEFGAKPQIDFEPEGLRYEIAVPLWRVAANSRKTAVP
ncbi:MAG: HWE histidine kinase domain-containing protein [Rhizomicrobium sp.]